MTIQKCYALPLCKEYSNGYATLIKKLAWLQLSSVPKKEIQLLLTRERKLLELMKVKSTTNSPTWFEDLCSMKKGTTRLLLSGYNTGHESGVQTELDFSEADTELFAGHEMGDDVLHALHNCMQCKETVQTRLRQEIPVLTSALRWSRSVTG